MNLHYQFEDINLPYNTITNWPHVFQTLPTMSSTAHKTKTNPIKLFSLWTENLITEIQIDKTQILKSTTSKTPSWLLKQPKILLNLTKYQKIHTLLSSMKNSFTLKVTAQPYPYLYWPFQKWKQYRTAIQHNTKITKQLPNSTSIYCAESKAIDLALNIITQTESIKFIIFF